MLFVILILRLSDALPTVRGCFLERHQVIRTVDSVSGQRQYYFVHRGATALLESKKCSCDAESRCAFRLKPDGKGHSVASFTPLARDQLEDVVDSDHSRAKGRRTVAMTTHHEMSNGNATVQIVCNGRCVVSKLSSLKSLPNESFFKKCAPACVLPQVSQKCPNLHP